MDFGSYFLKSEKHKAFLELLFSGAEAYSKTDLAKLSGLPYATTHAELSKLESMGLLTAETSGGITRYRMQLSSELKKAMRLVFNFSSRKAQVSNHDELRAQLQKLGAPVVLDAGSNIQPKQEYSLEETIVRSSLQARNDPSVARTLPIALFKSIDLLDDELLKYWATRLEAKQEVGLFLELTSIIVNSPRHKTLSRKFKDARVKETKDFFETNSPLLKQVSEKNTPDVARRWKFRLNMSMDSFQSTFDRFIASKR